jgi:hypothetical protein
MKKTPPSPQLSSQSSVQVLVEEEDDLEKHRQRKVTPTRLHRTVFNLGGEKRLKVVPAQPSHLLEPEVRKAADRAQSR